MSLSFQFDQDAETVCNQMSDPDFRIQQCLALGELSATCDLDGTDSEWSLSMRREVERDELPSFVAKIFGSKQTMELVQVWRALDDGSYEGEDRIRIVGQPVEVNSTFTLKPSGDGCVMEASHTAKVKVPLVGGKIEKFVLGQIRDGWLKEMEYTRDTLNG